LQRLTARPQRTYSASGAIISPASAALFSLWRNVLSGRIAAPEIEDRFDEMAKGTFGERLKRERELREVSLKEIASATRIAQKFLDALENEQWDKLPGGVFGRGFVRSIARYLGLSEENLLSDYDLARGETGAPPAQKPDERIPGTPKWIPALVAVLLLAALIGIGIGGRYVWRWYAVHRALKKASSTVSLPASEKMQNVSAANIPSHLPVAASGRPTTPSLSVIAAAAPHVKIPAYGAAVHDAELARAKLCILPPTNDSK